MSAANSSSATAAGARGYPRRQVPAVLTYGRAPRGRSGPDIDQLIRGSLAKRRLMGFGASSCAAASWRCAICRPRRVPACARSRPPMTWAGRCRQGVVAAGRQGCPDMAWAGRCRRGWERPAGSALDPDEAQQARTRVFLSQAGSGRHIAIGHGWVSGGRNSATEKLRCRRGCQLTSSTAVTAPPAGGAVTATAGPGSWPGGSGQIPAESTEARH